ncbi:MAG: YjfB family protein [Oscillospiraceae bacterium]|nr:YjfB family protein [Oscillospiraceae bacterium]
MDMSTAIASMAMSMSQASVQQSLSTSMMKKAMDVNATLAQGTIEMINDVSPARAFGGDIGAIFDARA